MLGSVFQTEGIIVRIQEVEATLKTDAKIGRQCQNLAGMAVRPLGYRQDVPPLSVPAGSEAEGFLILSCSLEWSVVQE